MCPVGSLFSDPVPPPIEGIDLRCCGVDEVLSEVRGARLIVADPPWCYSEKPGVANPEANGIYSGISDSAIVHHLDRSYDCAGHACRLAVWYTWPKDAEWNAAGGAGSRWGARVTGGAWTKMQLTMGGGARRTQQGVGYHWFGQTEPVAVFTRGACGRPNGCLYNGHVSPPGDHSEKPWEWMRQWILAWTDPGDLVVDLYAGMAPLARACLGTGRRYVGAEIDRERWGQAMGRLHRHASMVVPRG